MRKVVAAINMTLDGVFDHNVIIPDEEIHQHYEELIHDADVLLYGRITYELMKYWQNLVNHPSGEKSIDDFAVVMDKVPKIVFSHILKDPEWESAKLSNKTLEEEVMQLKQSHNGESKDILVGSRSLIIQLIKLNLIDEFQLCVHPVIAGKGLKLFDDINARYGFKLIKTKTFKGGAIILYYQIK